MSDDHLYETCVKCGESIKNHRPSPGCPYNGWTNYETWAVKLWMDNEEGSYRALQEMAQTAWDNAMPGEYEWQTREQQAVYALAKQIQDEHEEAAEEALVSGRFSDLLNAALSEVNWSEIAESLLEDVDKSEPEAEHV